MTSLNHKFIFQLCVPTVAPVVAHVQARMFVCARQDALVPTADDPEVCATVAAVGMFSLRQRATQWLTGG
jgi:hypothetical protein